MPAVEAVLQVDASLSNQVVPSHQVVVVDQHRQQRLLRELGLYLKGPGRKGSVGKSVGGKSDTKHNGLVPAKHRVQLLGDVVVPVFDLPLAKPENNVRVCFPVRVSRVQV